MSSPERTRPDVSAQFDTELRPLNNIERQWLNLYFQKDDIQLAHLEAKLEQFETRTFWLPRIQFALIGILVGLFLGASLPPIVAALGMGVVALAGIWIETLWRPAKRK